jgi:nitroreductase
MKQAAPSYETQALREFEEVLKGRRTIELFLEVPVPQALLKEAIDTAVWAPNHRVTEPWHFYVLGPETRERCLDLCAAITDAKKGEKAAEFKRKSWSEKPSWLVVTCRRSEDALLQQEDYAACAAALQNLSLYLWKAGVGTKWTTGAITRDPRFFEIVGIDADAEFVVGLIWAGYPKLTPTQSRKGGADVTTHLP